MNDNQLKELGLTEAQIEQVQSMHKAILDGKYIPKHKFDELNNKNKNLVEQGKALEDTIAKLKPVAEDVAKYKEVVEQGKKQIEELEQTHNKNLYELELEYAIKNHMRDICVDVDSAYKLLPKDTLSLNKDKTIAKDTLNSITQFLEEKKYLAKQVEKPVNPNDVLGNNGIKITGTNISPNPTNTTTTNPVVDFVRQHFSPKK